ncbi:ribonuclease 3 [bacterium BMS3Abin02]|nr:ribonuclease 3 [bacterium BMS3Abin02]GBE23516.1 ribonuclease 3 [bacterium BMS3Bbin01]HDH27213.1 ribonuclease III [Actinomycetota bacterium]HDK45880.1 ribonuclease III [Actinomycetota bacterium]HDL48817.1 ribonuclease III [Actinomycetota bacterium]
MTGIEARLGHQFRNPALLETALTHRSFTAEHDDVEHNERMEFLGDAVLGLVITDVLFGRFGDMREGQMAKLRASLVSRPALASVARTIGLGTGLRIGHGEEVSDGRGKDSILADAMEAVLAAVYLDGGLEEVRRVIVEHWEAQVAALSVTPGSKDYKTRLQEVLAKVQLEPVYQVHGDGPDHDRTFRATVEIDGVVRGEGEGHSKKEAQQAAARVALERLADSP